MTTPATSLGAFSISLAVKDLAASRTFYETFGFTAFGGNGKNWVIMKNGPHLIGEFVGRRVRPGRHRPHDGQPLRRHLHAVMTQELVHLVGRLRVGRFRHSADLTTDSGLSQILDTFRYRERMVVAMRAGKSEGDLVVHQSPDRDRGEHSHREGRDAVA